jgi:ABC-type Na+ transport system ATPase subunit NatA
MASSAPAVSVQALTKRFRGRVAVDRLSFEVPVGVVAGFVGPDAAGKSTTLAMLVGLVRPTAGSATVLGHHIANPVASIRRVGALIEAAAFYGSLSGRQNLELVAHIGGDDLARVQVVFDEVGLAARADDRYRTYSMGMKQRLGIAALLLGDPDVLLLDEPASGLNSVGIVDMRALLSATARRRTVGAPDAPQRRDDHHNQTLGTHRASPPRLGSASDEPVDVTDIDTPVVFGGSGLGRSASSRHIHAGLLTMGTSPPRCGMARVADSNGSGSPSRPAVTQWILGTSAPGCPPPSWPGPQPGSSRCATHVPSDPRPGVDGRGSPVDRRHQLAARNERSRRP